MKAKIKQNEIQNEDQDILSSIENGEWKAVNPMEHKRLLGAFGQQRKKDSRINVRLAQTDLLALQMRAAREGLPYHS